MKPPLNFERFHRLPFQQGEYRHFGKQMKYVPSTRLRIYNMIYRLKTTTMTKQILFLSLLLSGAAMGQNKTIKVMMLVCDTQVYKIHHDSGEVAPSVGDNLIIYGESFDERKTNESVWWVRGYEVIAPSQENNYNSSAAVVSIWNPSHPGYAHLSYLDEKKKPLKYFVWLSKQTP